MSFCSFFGGEVFQNHFEPGVYVCAKCGYELFSSRSKYAHSSPWPAFTETIHADSVAKRPEHNQPEALKCPLPACLDLPFWVLILRWVLALTKAGACLPQAVLGNRMQTEVAPTGCSNPSHYMIHSG
ncbi:hypothetical protein mRhiFer1_009655 [Rhinolophus ferrumequinum]|uniref:Methionine-R-sulfoxide reductase B1 n=1 Tax=Rhinolophus ferrumequinum TaxID=59479 RepID=A0A7J7R5Z2_RHIFE|nr:hypothetical protein mRhiFer1_009655 [Rhinolophus ferrumequinum]